MNESKMLKRIPTVPLDENREMLLIKRHGKTLEIPFTDIDRIEMDIRINGAMYGSEYYVMVVYLKNGGKYEEKLPHPGIFEAIYEWGIEKGIIYADKERDMLMRYRDEIMEKARRNSALLNRISILMFVTIMLGVPGILYMTGVKTSFLDLLASALLFTSISFIIFLLAVPPSIGYRLKAMVATFLYRNSLFRVIFEKDSGVDMDHERFYEEKKKGFRAMTFITGFLGLATLISSPLYHGTRLFSMMLLFGILLLAISLFMWKN